MTWIDVLTLIGAIGLFLYGLRLMSEGLQKVAGSKMRAVLGKITNNPVSGILTGTATASARRCQRCVVTALLQC